MAHCLMATGKAFLEMEGRGVLQDLIPMMGQLKLAYVPINGWIIDYYVHGLLDGYSNVAHLPIHHGKFVHIDVMI